MEYVKCILHNMLVDLTENGVFLYAYKNVMGRCYDDMKQLKRKCNKFQYIIALTI